ncbi:MAG: hypothetical protein KAJ19_11300 [Gammaproteobacteria bacterium]|nr:hypothetical protein [Gammaproteobacteria bacterium]
MNKTQKARLEWIQELTALAESIRGDQYDLLNQKTYAAELLGALKRNKLDHKRNVSNDADRMGLTNQSKRDADLNRRMFNDTQRETFNDDLKKINRKMADLEIEVEYKRSILQIKLASVIEDVI